MIRQTAVAGQFYPASCQEIEDQIARFNELLDQSVDSGDLFNAKARMVIVPHAGYNYSGFTANVAHRVLQASKAKRVVVIGPSHRVYIKGASISLHESYQTPCGSVDMDVELAQSLQKECGFIFQEDAHFEHSTETQMPFIKHYLPQAKLCEIVYGDIDHQVLSHLIESVLDDPQNVVVISTDLSHFYTLDKANKLDNICLEAMAALDSQKMQSGGCEACGKTGVLAAMEVAKRLDLTTTLLDYRTSADVTKDRNSVVGYVSAYMM